MTWLVIMGKIFGTIVLLIFLGVGLMRASPRYTTRRVSRNIDALVGALFFIIGFLGLYFLWLH